MTSTVLAKEFDGKLWVLADYLQQAINDACMTAVLAEREACAKFLLSTDLSGLKGNPEWQNFIANLLANYAAAIRARSINEL